MSGRPRLRPAAPADGPAIRNVLLKAFPTAAEADLVERLEADGDSVVSIVAEDECIFGHVLLSRMFAEADGRRLQAVGLGPVAVLPERQGGGTGSALVEAAVREARERGEEIVFLVGEPGYYRRFGFDAAAAQPFESPYAGPYFQALKLTNVPPVTFGAARYAAAFAELGDS